MSYRKHGGSSYEVQDVDTCLTFIFSKITRKIIEQWERNFPVLWFPKGNLIINAFMPYINRLNYNWNEINPINKWYVERLKRNIHSFHISECHEIMNCRLLGDWWPILKTYIACFFGYGITFSNVFIRVFTQKRLLALSIHDKSWSWCQNGWREQNLRTQPVSHKSQRNQQVIGLLDVDTTIRSITQVSAPSFTM